jgi:hypothetical protein
MSFHAFCVLQNPMCLLLAISAAEMRPQVELCTAFQQYIVSILMRYTLCHPMPITLFARVLTYCVTGG